MNISGHVVTQRPAGGRPRDPRIDETVLLATVELLEQRPYAEVTMAAIASRAGTSKPALYRRWPSKAHLIHEAVFRDDIAQGRIEGDLAAVVRAMVAGTRDVFTRPAARTAVPGLLADMGADPSLHARLMARFRGPVWDELRERLDQAARDGHARRGTDSTILIQLVVGAVIVALSMRPDGELDDGWVEATTDHLLKGIEP